MNKLVVRLCKKCHCAQRCTHQPGNEKYPRNVADSDATDKKEGEFLMATQSSGQDC